ncbi:MAG: hypothetical protein M1480_15510 [Bacteroidetes bacterium]|nr:hypothetical protein [Bacteroidota bacterium]
MIFKFLGVINLANEEILSYTFIFYGLSSVYASMGKGKKLRLFIGTAVFLIGIILFIMIYFDMFYSPKIIFPSTLLILGISSLMLFLDNTKDKAVLFISLIFILIGIVYSVSVGMLRLNSFIFSFYHILLKYWIIILIAIIIVAAIRREDKK